LNLEAAGRPAPGLLEASGRGSAVLAGILLLAFQAAWVLPRLGARDFWPPDEARYGLVSRSLVQGEASLLVPWRNGELYPDKPPGYFLAVLAAARVSGRFDEGVVRLPAALASILLVAGLGAAVARSAGFRAGLLTGCLLASMVLFAYESRQAHLDLSFGAALAAAILLWRRGLAARSLLPTVFGAGALFLAIFVKGPHALLVLPVLVIDAAIERRLGRVLNLRLLLGLAVTAAGVLVWLLLARAAEDARSPGAGSEYLRTVRDQFLARVSDGEDHVKPWFTYPLRLPGNVFPASLFLVPWILPGVRRSLDPRLRPLCRLSAVWVLVFLAVMSSVRGKREIYLLPVHPALAILAASAVLAAARSAQRTLAGLSWSAAALLLLVLAAGSACFLSEEVRSALEARIGRPLPAVAPDGIPLQAGFAFTAAGAALLLGAALGALCAGRPAAGAGWSAAAWATACGLAGALLLPAWDVEASRRPVGEALARHAAADAPAWMFFHLDEGVGFYAGRDLPEVPGRRPDGRRQDYGEPDERSAARCALEEALRDPRAVAVVRERDVARFELPVGGSIAILERVAVGDDAFLIVGGRR
jgi:4-amino-4-deoxy-L-arabinose transferase-like glycosyltransferase